MTPRNHPGPTRVRAAGAPWLPRRRGSALLFAVGVLAVLAVVALAYTSSVRVERASTRAYALQADVAPQADVVIDEIASLLTADLFGNKIVTADTPRWDNPANPSNFPSLAPTQNFPIWPAMFEDGKFITAPTTDVNRDTNTFRRAPVDRLAGNLGQAGNPGVVLSPRRVAGSAPGPVPAAAPRHESAFLAAADPVDASDPFGINWDTWPQITNLRSAYRLYKGQDLGLNVSQSPYVWLRDDGRYADLAQFFLSPRARLLGHADPEADLADTPPAGGGAAATGFGQEQRDAPVFAVNQRVFKWQLSAMAEVYNNVGASPNLDTVRPVAQGVDETISRPLERIDERFWADADGDLRPDARWQVLDALDGRQGYRWVVAARIIDSSSRINVNTALDSGYIQDFNNQIPPAATPAYEPFALDIAQQQLTGWDAVRATIARGNTPADVDLYRFLLQSRLSPNLASDTTAWPVGGAGGGGGPLMQVDRYNWANGRLAWRLHLDRGLGLTEWINATSVQTRANAVPPVTPAFVEYNTDGDARWRYRAGERTAAYRGFLSGAALGAGLSAFPYGEKEELDLRAYDGLNNDAVLSRLEERLDFGYLPGDTATYNSGDPLRSVIATGPLRAAHPTAAERTFGLVVSSGGQPSLSPRVEDIRDSVRRYLTTASGVANFSPVPVLNQSRWPSSASILPQDRDRPVYPRSFNELVPLRAFAGPSTTGAIGAGGLARRADLIGRAFESFAWALAPLATDVPLIPGMDPATALTPPIRPSPAGPAVFDTGNVRNNASAFSYGGGSVLIGQAPGTAYDSPAAAIARANMNEDMGAAYAVLRAASLAVNLADASDAENDPNDEQPTVVRLYNRVLLSGDAANPDVTPGSGVIPLGVRFSHGDIAFDNGGGNKVPHLGLLPPRYVGQPNNGVTLVGLERQLFLREASTLAIYQNPAAHGAGSGQPPVLINPANADNQLGSVLAFELGNPWPSDVTTAPYSVRIQNSLGWVEIKLPTVQIPAGETRVFYWRSTIGPDITEWDGAFSAWLAAMNFPSSGNGSAIALPPATTPTLVVNGVVVSPITDPVIFQQLAPGGATPPQAVVALIFSPSVTPGALLVDRMSPGPTETKLFPSAFDNGVPKTIDPDPTWFSIPGQPVRWTGRAALASTLRRPTDTPASNGVRSGFPAYIVESSAKNIVNRTDPIVNGSNLWFHRWRVGPTSTDTPLNAEHLINGPGFNYVQLQGVGMSLLGRDKGEHDRMPPMQLFVPNSPLISVSELQMLGAFCTMYVHGDATPGTSLNRLASNVSLAPPALPAAPAAAAEGYWITLGEHLGNPANFTGGLTNGVPGSSDPVNAYLGQLDPTRYILDSATAPSPAAAGMGQVPGSTGANGYTGLPDWLAVPLAARVVDAFDARGVSVPLSRGVININTAPLRVLRAAPYVAPWFPVSTGGFAGGLAHANSFIVNNRDRAALLVDYRDARNPQTFGGGNVASSVGRGNYVNLPGLRGPAYPDQPSAQSGPVTGFTGRGIASLGEVPMLAYWDFDQTTNASKPEPLATRRPNPAYADFAEAAEPDTSTNMLSNAGNSASLAAGAASIDGVLDLRAQAVGSQAGSLVTFDPVADAEQRLLVFRGMSNSVSIRSDVFTAWFIIRAYDPKLIASIEMPTSGAPSPAQVRDAFERLVPAHESRWLVVFDRSNVRSPADRPRVLYKVELPVR